MSDTVPADPIIIQAVDAIDEAAGYFTADRATAAGLLALWPHYERLTARQQDIVLSRYKLAGEEPDSGGWLSGPCASRAEVAE